MAQYRILCPFVIEARVLSLIYIYIIKLYLEILKSFEFVLLKND